jgi:hypothetical protein
VKGTERRADLAPVLRTADERRAILWAGEQRGWWAWWLAMPDGYYAVEIRGKVHVFSAEEVDRIPLDSVYTATPDGWKTGGVTVPNGAPGF